MMIQLSRIVTLSSYFGLMILLLLWVTWLAPHPRYPVALVLMVSVVPLLLPLKGLLYGRVYTHAWTTFLALFYFVISVDDIAGGMVSPWLAWLELSFSVGLFGGCVAYTRLRGRQQRMSAAAEPSAPSR